MRPIREHPLELGGAETRALELEGSGPPLVLLHGFADSADTWRPLLELLRRRGRRAVAYDLPGFGAATPLDRDRPVLPQLDRFAAAAVWREQRLPASSKLSARLEHLAAPAKASAGFAKGWRSRAPRRRVVLVGNSLGGCVAMRAAEDPDLPVAGVVPVAPAGLDMARWISIIEGEWLLRALMRAPVPVPEIVVRETVGLLYRRLAFHRPPAVDPAVTAGFTRHIPDRSHAARILGTGRRLLPELQNPFRLERISCPVMIVWGERDRMVLHTGADRVLAEIPGATLELIEDCGHCPQIEAPERLVELLETFPRSLARAA